MRITYRRNSNKEYWTNRWVEIPADEPMTNTEVYPLKYAERIINEKGARILEAGCGAGRLMRFYHDKGHDIIGFDYIKEAIDKLLKIDKTLKVEVGDITNLHYEDSSFNSILAFGLYHNLEEGLQDALNETVRVLKPGGRLCASFRADNLQNKINDSLSGRDNLSEYFHKLNLTKKEFSDLLTNAGLIVEEVHTVVNMPLLYKFRIFRHKRHKEFNENLGRKEGYQLSGLGRWIQFFLLTLFASQFCNLYVVIAKKV